MGVAAVIDRSGMFANLGVNVGSHFGFGHIVHHVLVMTECSTDRLPDQVDDFNFGPQQRFRFGGYAGKIRQHRIGRRNIAQQLVFLSVAIVEPVVLLSIAHRQRVQLFLPAENVRVLDQVLMQRRGGGFHRADDQKFGIVFLS